MFLFYFRLVAEIQGAEEALLHQMAAAQHPPKENCLTVLEPMVLPMPHPVRRRTTVTSRRLLPMPIAKSLAVKGPLQVLKVRFGSFLYRGTVWYLDLFVVNILIPNLAFLSILNHFGTFWYV